MTMRVLAIVCLPLLTGCVSFNYGRHSTFEAVSDVAIGQLEIGTSDIGQALALLGAPLYVWEGTGDSVVLAYGSEDRKGIGFGVSVPMFEQASASFNYDDESSRLEGYVLVFDADLKLELVRAGLLRELGKFVRVRPGTTE
jgi:hypothetical protein